MSDAESLAVADAATQALSELFGLPDDNPDEGIVEPEEVEDEDGDEDDDDDLDEEPSDEEDDESEDDDDVDPDEDDDDDAQAATDGVIELSEDDIIRIDGEEIAVKDAVLFQRGFTSKAQALAKEREALAQREAEVEETYNQLQEWVNERAGDPVAFAHEVLGAAPDKNVAAAMLLRRMAQAGELDPGLAEYLGLEQGKFAEVADRGQEADRLARIEEQLQAQQAQQQVSARQRELFDHYLGQWSEIKSSHGLDFTSADDERAAFQEAVKFAAERQIVDLRDAYVVKTHQPGSRKPSPKDPVTTKRKQAQGKVARRSAAGKTKVKQEPERPLTTEEAAEASIREFLAQGA